MKHSNLDDLVSELTLEEKASLLSGANFWNTKEVERLDVPSMMLTDGPHGLRKQGGQADHLGLNKSVPATCFPPAATLANSWDVALLKRIGEALGEEAAAEDVAVLLGPGLNIKRSPLAGRNFEYFSEDPYLNGKLASALVQGIQSTGVAACPKHFAVNSQEKNRMGVDEIVDDRAMHELYLEGFREVVENAHPKVIMSSYNKVNGTYAHENHHLLKDILRDQWGFDGMVVSDWGGTNDTVAAVRAGGTLQMPSTGGETDKEIVLAVESGDLDESEVDDRVKEVLKVLFETRPAMGAPKPNFSHHHTLAVRAAAESTVLLENDGILPLKGSERVAVIGDFASTPRYQGAGSSLVNPTQIDSAIKGLDYEGVNVIGFAPGFKRLGGTSKKLKREALDLARKSDVTLLFLGLDEAAEAEGLDRRHMRLDAAQLELAHDILAAGIPTVVVLAGGAPVELPFAPYVNALVHGYLGGQGGGSGLAKVLTGRVDASGRLAETYALRYEDTPAAPWYLKNELSAEHRESIYLGYRYFDKNNLDVRYPFGYGLSYTTFEVSHLKASKKRASVTVTNTGELTGSQVVQVYVTPPGDGFVAPKQLKGFVRVVLKPGQSQRVTVHFDDHTFAHYSTAKNKWVTVRGDHGVLVGFSSRDLRESTSVNIKSGTKPKNVFRGTSTYESGNIHNVTEAEFEDLIGRPLPNPDFDPAKPLDGNSLIAEAALHSAAGKALVGALGLAKRVLVLAGKPIEANYTHFLAEMPLRAITRMSAGKVSPQQLEKILKVLNGQPVRKAETNEG